MDISSFEDQLLAAQAKWYDTLGYLEEMSAARETLLSAERALSLAKGEETALACEWEVPWEIGAPSPHVVASEGKTFLMYYAQLDQPSDEDAVALVEFIGCYAFKLGGLHEDVMNGHPLYHKGLCPFRAHVIANSRWLAQEEKIHKGHPGYNPESWKWHKHYLLLFHDDTFECLAKDYKIEVVRESLEQVSQIALARVFDWMK